MNKMSNCSRHFYKTAVCLVPVFNGQGYFSKVSCDGFELFFYCKSADDYLLYPFLNPASSLVLNISLIGYSRSNGVLTRTQKVIG